MISKDKKWFYKPCTFQEIDFYNSANARHKEFADLMPCYIGALQRAAPELQSLGKDLKDGVVQLTPEEMVKLAEKMQAEAAAKAAKDNNTWVRSGSRKINSDLWVVLNNATHGYKKPNILDVKLGSRLWADDAPMEKRARFDDIAKATTHQDYGFRISGMRVFQGSADANELNDNGYRVYDKNFGRYDVNGDNLVDSFRRFIFNPASGIDEELARGVAEAFATDLKHVQEVMENEESRMYSASLLFIFEGDGEALRAALEESNKSQPASAGVMSGSEMGESVDNDVAVPLEVLKESMDGPFQLVALNGNGEKPSLGRSNTRVDSGIVMDEAGELIVSDGEALLSDDESVSMEFSPVYSLNLIDFAHADWVPGQGPDENCLKGVRSLVDIFTKLSETPEISESTGEGVTMLNA
jgi:1D-myo-inositol-tetrakisphosphate 5-kinase/inositol-polyphosphate multikinase